MFSIIQKNTDTQPVSAFSTIRLLVLPIYPSGIILKTFVQNALIVEVLFLFAVLIAAFQQM